MFLWGGDPVWNEFGSGMSRRDAGPPVMVGPSVALSEKFASDPDIFPQKWKPFSPVIFILGASPLYVYVFCTRLFDVL